MTDKEQRQLERCRHLLRRERELKANAELALECANSNIALLLEVAPELAKEDDDATPCPSVPSVSKLQSPPES